MQAGHNQAEVPTPNRKRSPLFLSLAAVALVLALFTPRLLLTLPMFGLFAFSLVSLFRKERGAPFAVVILGLGIGLLWLNSQDDLLRTSSVNSEDLSAIEIADWNWSADPDFAGDGAIKWNVSVRNTSQRNVAAAEVRITTYDQAGKLIATDSMYVTAIPAGGTRSDEGYADYYGTESNANVQVTDVRYAD
jgi:hypothetical protein